MTSDELSRRRLLKRAGQAGGLIASGGMLEYILAACGGNVSTPTGSGATPGATKVVPAGLKSPSVLQWGSDYVSGAPYVFQDPANPKNLVGFEVEIAQAIAALMGITETQVEVDYSNLEQALAANQFDMVMNGWEKNADREKTELFSDPYYRYGQQIIVRKDDTRFANLGDPTSIKVLEGYTVGTGSGYLAQTIMQGDSKINIKAYDGNIAFSDLVQKKVDAFFLDSPIAAYYILGSGPGATAIPQLTLLGKPIYPDNYYCGFNKSNANAAKLLPTINQAFAILKSNGTLKKIYQKWQMWNDQQADIGIV
jgi:polar amino acid transport system substrate-binding protein